MFTVGIDPHKRLLVAHAIDNDGREAGDWQGPNTPAGWQDFLTWMGAFPAGSLIGVEGAYSYGRGLSQLLVAEGWTVYDINPRWTARRRTFTRRPQKSDRLDARAVALIVRQDAPDLPLVQCDDESSTLQLLVRERANTLRETTRLSNQLHALLFLLDPTFAPTLGSLRSRRTLLRLAALQPHGAESARPGARCQRPPSRCAAAARARTGR